MLERERSTASIDPEPHEDFMARLTREANTAMTRIEAPCGWCGIRCIDTREEHERLVRQSETTWRSAA